MSSIDHIRAATSRVEAFNDQFQNWLQHEEPSADLQVTLVTYFKVRDALDALEGQMKIAAALVESMSRRVIPDRMRQSDTKTISLASVQRRFTVTARMSASIIDKPRGHLWLSDNGHGDLIQPTVNASSLSSFAKAYLNEKGEDLPAEIFKVSTMEYTSVTKL
jgi:hypothetical protein